VSSEISRALRVLWGEPDKSAGRGLSRERIVAAAVELADSQGLAGLSMAKLAERLGCAPMSLYRHVSNKDELLAFMLDAAPGPPPELPGGWRDGLTAWSRSLRGVYFSHPWILQVTPQGPPADPGQLAWLDRGLSALGDTSLPHAERMQTVMALLNYVRGESQLVIAGAREGGRQFVTVVEQLVRADRFPALAEAVRAGAFRGEAEDPFEFGLTRILDGVNVLLTE
jgi:AcrR family transcriptional regulator